jgi:hypothetical protein
MRLINFSDRWPQRLDHAGGIQWFDHGIVEPAKPVALLAAAPTLFE